MGRLRSCLACGGAGGVPAGSRAVRDVGQSGEAAESTTAKLFEQARAEAPLSHESSVFDSARFNRRNLLSDSRPEIRPVEDPLACHA